ncbi:MAG: type II toxin-antitoxin system VapB family antitoxin [Candidatus Asgardarchaeia archaeon]
MEVVSFRIPKELKESMKEIGINWSEEVRMFIESKVREYKRKNALEEIDSMLKNLPKTEKGTAKKYVREDRDSN